MIQEMTQRALGRVKALALGLLLAGRPLKSTTPAIPSKEIPTSASATSTSARCGRRSSLPTIIPARTPSSSTSRTPIFGPSPPSMICPRLPRPSP